MNIAFVFPGQGSQWVGMGRDLYKSFPEVKLLFDEASEILDYNVAKLCFEGPKEELNKTHITQPCLLTASIAAYQTLRMKGITPSIVAGHSLGEYSALVAAESITFKDALIIASLRGRLMQEAVPEGQGAMAAILGLERSKLEALCAETRGYVAPANYNCPGQIVISGEKEAVSEACKKALAAGAMKAIPLAVSVPSHSLMMKEAAEDFEPHLKDIEIKTPVIDFINNADARLITEPDEIRESLIRQLYCPVLWEDSVRLMAKTTNVFIEVGPSRVLAGLIKRIVKEAVLHNVESTETLNKTLENLSN